MKHTYAVGVYPSLGLVKVMDRTKNGTTDLLRLQTYEAAMMMINHE